MRAPNAKITTPVGAASLSGAVVTILMYFLGLWHWFAHLPGGVQLAFQVVITAMLVYLGGWLSVVRSAGQQVSLTLTPSVLPTVQLADNPSDPTRV